MVCYTLHRFIITELSCTKILPETLPGIPGYILQGIPVFKKKPQSIRNPDDHPYLSSLPAVLCGSRHEYRKDQLFDFTADVYHTFIS